jgi:hypothetical protein
VTEAAHGGRHSSEIEVVEADIRLVVEAELKVRLAVAVDVGCDLAALVAELAGLVVEAFAADELELLFQRSPRRDGVATLAICWERPRRCGRIREACRSRLTYRTAIRAAAGK